MSISTQLILLLLLAVTVASLVSIAVAAHGAPLRDEPDPFFDRISQLRAEIATLPCEDAAVVVLSAVLVGEVEQFLTEAAS